MHALKWIEDGTSGTDIVEHWWYLEGLDRAGVRKFAGKPWERYVPRVDDNWYATPEITDVDTAKAVALAVYKMGG